MSELERGKFEARFKDRYSMAREHGQYFSIHTRDLWEVYISLRAARSAPPPTRESLHVEWMAQEEYLDWSNFLLHKLTGGAAPADRAVWLAAINDELANLRAWANRAEADLRHTIFCMDRACKRCRDLMTKYPEPGESAPAGCPQCGSVNRDYCNPECSNIFTRNEWHRLAAPAPTGEK